MESKFDFSNWDKTNNLFKNNDVQSKMIASSVIENAPEVTFTIPSYRRADVIQETIYSILQQKTNYKFIIMVIDDSGDDESVEKSVLEIIKSNKNIVLYKNVKNLGQAENWNRCIELAKTPWVILVHDDDMLCNNYLESVLPVAKRSNCSELGVFQYKYDLLKHKDDSAKKFNANQAFAQKILSIIRRRSPFYVHPQDIFQFITPSPGCWLINKDKAIKNGGFDPDFDVTLDGVFHFRNIVYGHVVIVPDFLMVRRVEENTFLKNDAQIQVIDMLYHFGLNMIKQNPQFSNKYYKIILDISIIHLGRGINAKYNGKININALLNSYGVNKYLLMLPSKIIFLLNCMFLSKLLFRKKL